MVGRVANLFILGLGEVGRTLARQVVEKGRGRIRIIGLSDSSGAIIAKGRGEFSNQQVLEFTKGKEAGVQVAHLPGAMSPAESIDRLPITAAEAEKTHGVTVVADCTASHSHPLLLSAISRGFRVASANKKPFAETPIEVFSALTAGGGCRFESTAGACTPFVAAALRLAHASDPVTRLQGTMSGTLGFVMSQLQPASTTPPPFSTVLQAAIDGGYTEPDCREDLSGADVARKALILARVLGLGLSLSDVAVQPLFPPALASVPYKDFLHRVCTQGELDGEMAARAAAAAAGGLALRYVAKVDFEAAKVTVGVEEVPLSSPLGQLSGTANLVEFHSSFFPPDGPLVIQGCGAGGGPTAAGLLADIVELSGTAPPPNMS